MPLPQPQSGISSLPPLKAGTAPALSWLCSAVAGLSSLHPSIPPSGPAQWFIIHLGSCLPPPLCTRTALTFCLVPSYAAPTCVCCVCLRNDSPAQPERLHLEWLYVFILFWLCLPSSVIGGIRFLVWLSVCGWSLLLVLLLPACAKSAACPTFWSLCNNRDIF